MYGSGVYCVTCGVGFYLTSPKTRPALSHYYTDPCTLCDGQLGDVPWQYSYTPTVIAGTDTYTWSCWPGFTGSTVTRTCPITDLGRWTGNPPMCVCGPIESGHTCTPAHDGGGQYNPGAEGTDPNSLWSITYAWPGSTSQTGTWPSNWFYDPLTPGGRGAIMVAVKTEVFRSGSRVEFTYSASSSNLQGGLVVFLGLLPDGAIARYRIQVKKADGSPMAVDINFDPWSGALAALQAKSPTANAYLTISGPTDTFTFAQRYDVNTDGKGLVSHWQASSSLDKSRDVASASFRWLWRHCPAGTYQDGDICNVCPPKTYNRFPNMAKTAAGVLPCVPCACDWGCQTCDPVNGACYTNSTHCYVGVDSGPQCIAASVPRKAAEPCVSCQPGVSQFSWSATPAAVSCSDGFQCTFNDRCHNGTCSGTPADCLTLDRTGRPWSDCEVCGQDKCDKRPSYRGCVFKNSTTGARTCGCSVDSKCYAHGSLHPNNTCLQCDVVSDPTAWTPTVAKVCNDGNPCTSGDTCGAGVCSGRPYVCPIAGPCIASSTCDGNGGCLQVYRGNTTQCGVAVDACNPASVCDGRHGFCPPSVQLTPTIFTGSVVLSQVLRYASASDDTNSTNSTSSTPPRRFVYGLSIAAAGWTVGCGDLEFSVGVYVDTADGGQGCDPLLVRADGSGAGALAYVSSETNTSDGWEPFGRSNTWQRVLAAPPAAGTLVRAVVRARNLRGTLTYACSSLTVLDPDAPVAGFVSVRTAAGGPLGSGSTRISDEIYASTGIAAGDVSTGAGSIGIRSAVATGVIAPLYLSQQPVFTFGRFLEAVPQSTWGGQLNYSFAVGTLTMSDVVSSIGGGDDAFGTDTLPALDDVITWTNLGTGLRSVALDPISQRLPSHVPLYITVKATNRAGLSTLSTSLPIVMDHDVPSTVAGQTPFGLVTLGSMGTVTAVGTFVGPAGTSADGAAVPPSLLQCSLGVWSPNGPAPIVGYEVAWGTGGLNSLDVAAFAVVPGNAAASIASLQFDGWIEGVTYTCSVRAWTAAGAYAVSASTGTSFDSTMPVPAFNLPAFVSTPSQLLVSLSVDEQQSEAMSATIWIGTTFNGSDVTAPTTFSRNPSLASSFDGSVPGDQQTLMFQHYLTANATTLGNVTTNASTSWPDGTTMFVSAAVTNAVLLTGTTSSTIIIDGTAPVGGLVWHVDPVVAGGAGRASGGTNLPAVLAHGGPGLAVAWELPGDDVSGIAACVISIISDGRRAIGSGQPEAAFNITVVPPTPVSLTDTLILLSNVTTTQGWSYKAVLKCTNGAGLSRSITSAPVSADTTPPIITDVGIQGAVGTGYVNGRAFHFSPSADSLVASWLAYDDESAVVSVSWAIGVCDTASTAPGSIRDFTPAALPDGFNGANASDLTMSVGIDYCVTVEATNAAGLHTRVVSSAIRIDSTPPIIRSYPVIVASDPVLPVPVRDLPVSLLVAPSASSRLPGVGRMAWPAYAPVSSSSACVNGTCVVDSSAALLAASLSIATRDTPGLLMVSNTLPSDLGLDADFTPDDRGIAANWTGMCADDESGLTFSWCAGTSPGACDVLDTVDTGNATVAVAPVPSSLTGMGRVFVTVVCTNGAGLSIARSSDGIIADSTPPSSAGEVQLLDGSDHSPFLPNGNATTSGLGLLAFSIAPPTIRFAAFSTVAPIARITIAAGSAAGSSDLMAAFSMGSQTDIILEGIRWAAGRTVYISANVTSASGLTTRFGAREPLVFDPSPPVVGNLTVLPAGSASSSVGVGGMLIETLPLAEWLPLCLSLHEPESGIRSVQVLLGSGNSGSELLGSSNVTSIAVPSWSNIAATTFSSGPKRLCQNVSGLPLQPGLVQTVTVVVTNGAGSSSTSSVAFTMDASPPSAFVVYALSIDQASQLATFAGGMPTNAANATASIAAVLAAAASSSSVVNVTTSSGSSNASVALAWVEPLDPEAGPMRWYTIALVWDAASGSGTAWRRFVLDGVVIAASDPRLIRTQVPPTDSAPSGTLVILPTLTVPSRNLTDGRYSVLVSATTAVRAANVSSTVVYLDGSIKAKPGCLCSIAASIQPLLLDRSPPAFPYNASASVMTFAGRVAVEAFAAGKAARDSNANATPPISALVISPGARVTVTWPPAEDAHSGVVRYDVALVTAASLSALTNTSAASARLTTTPPPADDDRWVPGDANTRSRVLVMPANVSVSGGAAAAWVRAINGAGLVSHLLTKPVVVDGDAPFIAAVWLLNSSTLTSLRGGANASKVTDGAPVIGVPISSVQSKPTITVAWTSPSDSPSVAASICPAVVVHASLGSAPGLADLVPATRVAGPSLISAAGSTASVALLVPDDTVRLLAAQPTESMSVFATITATDCAGNAGSSTSAGVLAVASLPSTSGMAVRPAPAITVGFPSSQGVNVSWSIPAFNVAVTPALLASGTNGSSASPPRVVSATITLGNGTEASSAVCDWQSIAIAGNGVTLASVLNDATNTSTILLAGNASLSCLKNGAAIPPPGLTPGQRYYLLLAATDALGLRSVVASALPLLYDPSPPSRGIITAPSVSGRLLPLTISWSAWYDVESAVQYAVGLTTDAAGAASNNSSCCDIAPLTGVGSVLAYSWPSLTVPASIGQGPVYATVKGCNAAGLCSISTSGRVIINSTLPGVGSVAMLVAPVNTSTGSPIASSRIAVAVGATYRFAAASQVNITWAAITAPMLSTWRACLVGSGAQLFDGAPCAQGVAATTRWAVVVISSDLPHQAYVGAQVAGIGVDGDVIVSAASFTRSAVSVVEAVPGLVRNDLTPPASFSVFDGPVSSPSMAGVQADLDWTGVTPDAQLSPNRTVGCHWTAAVDPESGPVTYSAAIGSSAGGSDLVPWTSVGSSRYLTDDLPQSPYGGRWYCTVKAINSLYLSRVVSSDGWAVDLTEPLATSAVVMDGWDATTDAAWITAATSSITSLNVSSSSTIQNSTTSAIASGLSVWITWSGFAEPESEIAWYEASLVLLPPPTKSSNATTTLVPWARVPGVSTHLFTNVSIPHNRSVAGLVRAVNVAGLTSTAVSSSGARLDIIPPSIDAAVLSDSAWIELTSAAGGGPTAGGPAYAFMFDDNAMLLAPNTTAGPRMVIGHGLGNLPANDGSSSCTLSSWPSESVVVAQGPSDSDGGALVVTLGGTNVSMHSACQAGYFRLQGLAACVPCSSGTYKPRVGDDACDVCPVGTLSYAQAASAAALMTLQPAALVQRGLGLDASSAGITTCTCHATSQVFWDAPSLVNTSQHLTGCVCKPGWVVNPAWSASDQRSAQPVTWSYPDGPVPCLPIDEAAPTSTNAIKPFAGNERADIAMVACPAGSSPNPDRSDCICADSSRVFDVLSGSCVCPAGQWSSTPSTSCTRCPPGLYKAGNGDSKASCMPCPWGMRPLVPGHDQCVVDSGVISGGFIAAGDVPGTVAAACPAGTIPSITAASGQAALTGITATWFDPNSAEGGGFRALQSAPVPASLCLHLGSASIRGYAYWASATELASDGIVVPTGADSGDGAWYVNGTVIREGAVLGGGEGSALLVDLLVSSLLSAGANMSTATAAQYSLQPGQQCVPTASLPDFPITVTCSVCTSGLVQPLALPLTGVSQARTSYGNTTRGGGISCGACPPLQRGSFLTSSTPVLHLDWTGVFQDADSGLASYSYAVGLLPGGTQIVSYTSSGLSTTAVVDLQSAPPPPGSPMFLTVVATDAAGNSVRFQDARPVIYDTSPPTSGNAIDGSPDDLSPAALHTILYGDDSSSTSASTSVSAQGDAALSSAQLALGMDVSPSLAVDTLPTNSSNSTNTSAATYDWRLDATFTSVALLPEVDIQSSATSYRVTWEAFGDSASGIAALGACLGTVPFSCDVKPFTALPRPSLTGTVSTATLDVAPGTVAAGTTIFATVWGMNGLGMVSATATNGVLVDDLPPSGGQVLDVGPLVAVPESRLWWVTAATNDTSRSFNRTLQVSLLSPPDGTPVQSVFEEPASDLDCQVEGTGVGAAWQGFVSASGIARYSWAVGTRPFADNIVAWADVGLDLAAYVPTSAIHARVNSTNSSTGRLSPASSPLEVGGVVYASVRAESRAGLVSIVHSNGVRIIEAPPPSAALVTTTNNSANGTGVANSAGAAIHASQYESVSGFVCVSVGMIQPL